MSRHLAQSRRVVVRASGQSSLAAHAAQSLVSFEVDHVDEALGEGWNVLVSGRAHVVATPAEIDAVTSLGITPWAGDGRDTYIRIVASNMPGRLGQHPLRHQRLLPGDRDPRHRGRRRGEAMTTALLSG